MALTDKKRKTLENHGVILETDLLYVVPYKFYDFTEESFLVPENAGKYGAFCGEITYVEKTVGRARNLIKVRVTTTNGLTLFVNYIGSMYLYGSLLNLKEQTVTVWGLLQYSEEYKSYSMLNPLEIKPGRAFAWKYVYPKFKGISENWLKDEIASVSEETDLPETIPEGIRHKFSLAGRKEALMYLHHPTDRDLIKQGIMRNLFEDLLYFACQMERNDRKASKGSQYNLKSMKSVYTVEESLPYDLTADQNSVLESILGKIKDGRRVNALIQGDVGCGKSIVAFLSMLAMADSGYQSAIMAPTQVLAMQHYKELSGYASFCGYKTVFLGGGQKAKERKEILKEIETGEANLIVGTHAAIADSVKYHNLALCVIDEEHRFGVEQRKKLAEKAFMGVHTISLSATPIPRTVAGTVFGGMDIYEIHTMPSNRKRVKTAVAMPYHKKAIAKLIQSEIKAGHQAYVVCPLIDADDEEKKTTVKEAEKIYKDILLEIGITDENAVKGISGRMAKKDVEETLNEFNENKVKILVSTTVIEVGVNNPNATVMIIEDAWSFGLAQLHQLRGRVGRGSYQGYCVLKTDRPEERLDVIKNTTDGFAIAQEDTRLRGAGNLLGTEQTGNDRFLIEALNYPSMYKAAKQVACDMVNSGTDSILIAEMEKRSKKVFVNPQKIRFFGGRSCQKRTASA